VEHTEFVKKYKAGEITVLVDKNKAGDSVLSPLADKHNKPAHIFWTWFGIILTIPLPIVLFIFSDWPYALGSFVLGLMVSSASRKSAGEFVLQNMVGEKDFYLYVLLHGGAVLADKGGKPLKDRTKF